MLLLPQLLEASHGTSTLKVNTADVIPSGMSKVGGAGLAMVHQLTAPPIAGLSFSGK